MKQLLIIILIITSISAHSGVASSYRLEDSISLDQLYSISFDKTSPISCYSKLMDLNKDLEIDKKQPSNTLVYLPDAKVCPHIIPKKEVYIAIDELADENNILPRDQYTTNLEVTGGYYYSTINGVNLNLGSDLTLISENHYTLGVSGSFKFEKWTLEPGFVTRFIEFENNVGTQVENSKLNVSHIAFSSTYSYSDSWSFIFAQSFGESLMHEDNNNYLSLFKFYKWSPEIGIKWEKVFGDNILSSFQIQAGKSLVLNDNDRSIEGGLSYQVKYRIESLKEKKANIYFEIHNQVQEESSADYSQQLIYTGINIGINKRF